MSGRVLVAYMRDCKRYGWTPSVVGLKAYASNKYRLLRHLWLCDLPAIIPRRVGEGR